MGFRFRKSKNFGPLRITLGKHGLGASVGVKGFRVTKSATGRTRTTASIPGTGISYVSESSNGRGGGKVKKNSRKKVILIALGVIFALAVIGALSSKGGEAKPTPAPTPAVSKALPAAAAPSELPQATPAAERAFVLNTSSHVYHQPNCSSAKNIKDANRQEFTGTREEVEAMGYEACSRCGG